MTKLGLPSRRGQQFSGIEGEDVICEDAKWLHLEVKRAEKLNLHKAMAQSVGDAKEWQTPVVLHRRNSSEWLVTMRLQEWAVLVRRVLSAESLSPTTDFFAQLAGARSQSTSPTSESTDPACSASATEESDDVGRVG